MNHLEKICPSCAYFNAFDASISEEMLEECKECEGIGLICDTCKCPINECPYQEDDDFPPFPPLEPLD